MSPASIRYKLNLYYNPNVNQELTLQAACGSSGSLPLLPNPPPPLPFHYLQHLLPLALLYARLVAFDMPSCIYQIHQPLHAIAGETQREREGETVAGLPCACNASCCNAFMVDAVATISCSVIPCIQCERCIICQQSRLNSYDAVTNTSEVLSKSKMLHILLNTAHNCLTLGVVNA